MAAVNEGISFSFDENDGEGQEEDDLHFCGRCRSTFADIAEFMVHKKRCKQPKVNKVDLRKAAVTLAVDLDADLTLATDEAAVISLLANQLSHQNNQQQRSNEAATEDALDHLTLVLNEELEAVQKASVVKLKADNHHKRQIIQTTSIKTSDNQTKTSIKLVKSDHRKLHPCSVIGCIFTAQHTKDLTRHMRIHTGYPTLIQAKNHIPARFVTKGSVGKTKSRVMSGFIPVKNRMVVLCVHMALLIPGQSRNT
jgi:hypothetical protein